MAAARTKRTVELAWYTPSPTPLATGEWAMVLKLKHLLSPERSSPLRRPPCPESRRPQRRRSSRLFSPRARLTHRSGRFAVVFLVLGALYLALWGALVFGPLFRSYLDVVHLCIGERDEVFALRTFQQRSAVQAETKVFFHG